MGSLNSWMRTLWTVPWIQTFFNCRCTCQDWVCMFVFEQSNLIWSEQMSQFKFCLFVNMSRCRSKLWSSLRARKSNKYIHTWYLSQVPQVVPVEKICHEETIQMPMLYRCKKSEISPHLSCLLYLHNVHFMLFCLKIGFVAKSVVSQNRVCCNLRTFAWRKMEPQIISVEVCEYRLIGQYTINSAIASVIFCVECGCDLRSGQPLEPHC